MPFYGYVVKVGNIPGDATVHDLARMFASCGPLWNASIHTNPSPTRPGHGTVEFKTDQAAENAIRDMNGAVMNGRVLSVAKNKYYGYEN
ncbi:hypothetical protein ACQ4LE_009611 [Meloidogyne hapla]|uniref:RRM domain-containing protein n=1 Tax=Meloidogyne hapla TaxID=6305 RepID=A0A1I8B2L5_MELHA